MQVSRAHQVSPLGDIPGPRERTICELNCRLVTIRADQAEQPGPAYPEINLSSENLRKIQSGSAVAARVGGTPTAQDQERQGGGRFDSLWEGWQQHLQQATQAIQRPYSAALSMLGQQRKNGAGGSEGQAAAPIAWHPRQLKLAAAADSDHVSVYDVEETGPTRHHAEPPQVQLKAVLQHDLQHEVACLAWRPRSGATLAVGCSRGVCLWNLGRGPSGTLGGQRSAGGGGGWLTVLQGGEGAVVTSLAWSPSGQLLAAACAGRPGFTIWDVARGEGSHVQAGLGPVSLLRWSPCGSYLMAGGGGPTFHVWETQSWASMPWRSERDACRLLDAAWSPDGRVLLLAFEGARQLAALHFTAEPPSLTAQLLPVQLPTLEAPQQQDAGHPSDERGSVIRAMAWDPRGERLAVALGGGHAAAGLVALYATAFRPVVTARLIGFMRCQPASDPGGESEGSEGQQAEGGRQGESSAARPETDVDEPVALAFQPSFKQGSLLAVRRGSRASICPMYYTPSS